MRVKTNPKKHNPAAYNADRMSRRIDRLEQEYILESDWNKKKKIQLAIDKIQDALLDLPWDEKGRSPRVKKTKKRRANKTIIKAKTIGHLDVAKVHNPRRRRNPGFSFPLIGKMSDSELAGIYTQAKNEMKWAVADKARKLKAYREADRYISSKPSSQTSIEDKQEYKRRSQASEDAHNYVSRLDAYLVKVSDELKKRKVKRNPSFFQTAKKYTGKALKKIGGKLANPRKRKANRADITNIVRDYIRQGLNSREISAQMKEAGFSKSLIAEAKAIYKRELAYVKGQPVKRPVSRVGKKVDIEALRSKQRTALKDVKLRSNPGPYSIWVKKSAGADYVLFAKGLTKKAAEEKAKYFNSLQASIAVIDGTKPAFTAHYIASKEKPASNKGKRANAGKKIPPPPEWQVRALPGGRFDWQMREEWQGPHDVYKREFNTAWDLEYDLRDKFGAVFAKKVIKAAKDAKGAWAGNLKRNPRKRNDGAVERRERFAGHYSGDKELYFPEGTPQGLSTLGPLISITLDTGQEVKAPKGVYLCQDARGKLCLGATQNKPLWTGPAETLGEVVQVDYECRKPHLNEPGVVQWFHKFKPKRPLLKADGRGGLKFSGGDYTIEPEGITG